jgi:hypothetical protein
MRLVRHSFSRFGKPLDLLGALSLSETAQGYAARHPSLFLRCSMAVPSVAPKERRMARWARLELATDGLEIRCSVLLSYHREHTDPGTTKRLPAILSRANCPAIKAPGIK